MDNTCKIAYQDLPVYNQRSHIIEALQSHQVIIVESNTGSGKTTQIPIILHEAGYTDHTQMIGITQPRRIAAFSVSDIIRSQLQYQYPELSDDFVHYKIRFIDNTQSDTRIKIMTDGILLQEIKHDKLLSAYSVLVIDEAHERSLNIDFILGLLIGICKQRNDLKIIISSATINTKKFSQFFSNCPIISIDAPLYPVKIQYYPLVKNTHEKQSSSHKRHSRKRSKVKKNSFTTHSGILLDTIITIVKKSIERKEGNMLIFLSGERDIKNCLDRLADLPNANNTLHLLPLYGRLDKDSQAQVFFPAPKGKIKIVVATNIGETSITINDIAVIVDSGRVKLNRFHHHKLSSTLLEAPISRVSAIQRKGRAGRTGPGICYRLYSHKEYKDMREFTEEEILRTDLSEIVLRMAYLDIEHFEEFPFLSSPSKTAISTAVAFLQDMDALNEDKQITEIGNLMMEFPLSPVHARVLVEAMMNYPQVLSMVIIVLSFLTTPAPFLLPINEELEARTQHKHFSTKHSDFFSVISLFTQYRDTPYDERVGFCEAYYLDIRIMNEIVNVYDQLTDMVRQQGVFIGEEQNEELMIKAMIKGFMYNVCVHYKGSTYLNRIGEKIYIHPSSVMFDIKTSPNVIIAGEIVQTSKMFARTLTPIQISWIKDNMPYFHTQLNKVTSLLSSRTYSAQKKIQSIIESNTFLFRVSENSLLSVSNTDKPKRDTTSWNIRLGGKHYSLTTNHLGYKILSLTWKQVLALVENASLEELYQHGKLRCHIRYNIHVTLQDIKLSTLPIFCGVYGEMLSFVAEVPPSIHLPDAKQQRQTKEVVALLQHTMDMVIPPKKKLSHKKKTSANLLYQFLSLHMTSNTDLYLKPERSFMNALENTFHTLAAIEREGKQVMFSRRIKQEIERLYKHLTQAYEGNNI